MTSDKQLKSVNIKATRSKQKLDQALNVKEFAVLAGISYSVAREWFLLSGFPAIQGKVFWEDFVLWRRSQNSSKPPAYLSTVESQKQEFRGIISNPTKVSHVWPPRAARILADST
jgi:hypothetical protein